MVKRKFLHVGCGPKRKDATTQVFNNDDWEEFTLDIDSKHNPDYLGSMTDLSMIKDNTFDAIYSSHNIEHLYVHEAVKAVSEFNRVLGQDGYVMIICPDLSSVCEEIIKKGPFEPLYYTSANDPICGIDILYGWRAAIQKGNYYMAHKSGFDENSLIKLFKQNNFKSIFSVTRKNFYDIQLLAFKSEVSVNNGSNLLKNHIG